MKGIRPLPQYLVARYQGWRATTFEENRAWYQTLVQQGQRPRIMVVGCCDSRVFITNLFGSDIGEIFIHRNIANFIPPYHKDDLPHGTSAAIEYAITALSVTNLIVLGHSQCGGIEGAFHHCETSKSKDKEGFLPAWFELLRPGYEKVMQQEATREERYKNMETESIRFSLQNLLTFPFIAQAIDEDTLSLHGIWHDLESGRLFYLNDESEEFVPL